MREISFDRKSIRTRLIMAFVVTSFLPIALVNIVAYYNTSRLVRQNVESMTNANLEQIRVGLDVWLDSYEDILYQVYTDDDIVELVDRINAGEDVASNRQMLRRTLRGMVYTKDYVKFISVITDSGELVFYNQLTSATTRTSWMDSIPCAWAGSQIYGALVWSGDIASSFESMRNQLAAGLNMGLAGIPWWTTDIGGFHGGNPDDPAFRELFARWFAWGTFCPVMRLHGDREPRQPQYGKTGGASCCSGAANEVWSYGEKVYEICRKYMEYRERMRPYTRKLMKEAHEKGTPVMRTLFYMYPQDSACWDVEDEYMYGPDVLVAPVFYAGQTKRSVYLPEGDNWVEFATGKEYTGGQRVVADAPLDVIPVFVRKK